MLRAVQPLPDYIAGPSRPWTATNAESDAPMPSRPIRSNSPARSRDMAAVDPWGSWPPPPAPPPAHHLQTPTRPDASQPPASLAHVHSWRRDLAVGPPSPQPSPRIVLVRIHHIPVDWSEQSLCSLVDWSSRDLMDVQMLPFNRDRDEFRSAFMRYSSLEMAMDVTKAINDCATQVSAEIVNSSPAPRRHPSDPTLMPAASRQQSRFFAPPLGSMSPPSKGNPFLTSAQNVYPSQSPIGAHRSDRSSRALISNTLRDDDETRDLLRDPVAFAEHGATARRRATAPQLPVDRMAALSLNPFASSAAAYAPKPPSPVNGASMAYAPGGHGGGYVRHCFPPANPADQNPPCNTLYVGNLPMGASEEELKRVFSAQRGYKRLCYRTKQNGPMCFVEFADISSATKALSELYGYQLTSSKQSGIRLSFSKNPLGVRSGQQQPSGQGASGPAAGGAVGAVNGGGMPGNPAAGFAIAHGPPPGLAAPPSLGPTAGRASSVNPAGGDNYAAPMSTANTGGSSLAAPTNTGNINGAYAAAMNPTSPSGNPAASVAPMSSANANGNQVASLGTASNTGNYAASMNAPGAPGNFAAFAAAPANPNAANYAGPMGPANRPGSFAAPVNPANPNANYAAWSHASVNYATYPVGNYAISTNTGRNSAPGSSAANAGGNYPGASAFAAFHGFSPAAASRPWNSPPTSSNEAAEELGTDADASPSLQRQHMIDFE